MNTIHTNIKHHIGHDPVMVALRNKYYSESPLYSLPHSDPNSSELTQLFVVTDVEQGTKFNCLTHPGSYFSPSLATTENWSWKEWTSLATSVAKLRGWHICRFNMLTDSQASKVVSHFRKKGFLVHTSIGKFKMLSGTERYDWKTYLESRRSSFNRNQNRCRRLMDKNGFTFSSSLDIEEVMRVFTTRHTVKGADDYTVHQNFRGFLRELREAYIKQGRWYEIGIEKDGILAAFTLGFWDADNVFYAFQTCYDPAYHSLRLGALTFDRLIEDVYKRGCSHISFMGDSEYFRLFTDEAYQFQQVDVFSRTPKGYFLFLRRVLMRAACIAKRRILPLLKRGTKPAQEAVNAS